MNTDRIDEILEKLEFIRDAEEDMRKEKSILREELMGIFGIIQPKKQNTVKYKDLKLKFKVSTKRKLNEPLLLKDYNLFDSTLRKCFPLRPKLDTRQYKEMMIINPNLMAKYVTEKKVSYSLTVEKIAKKEKEVE